MQPNLLFRPSRERTRPQQILHLSHTSEQDISGKKPPNTLGTWRRCETALVRPEFLEVIDLANGHVWINIDVLDRGGIVEVDCGRVLGEES